MTTIVARPENEGLSFHARECARNVVFQMRFCENTYAAAGEKTENALSGATVRKVVFPEKPY